MFRYGDKVVIRDGSPLDGCAGIVYSTKDGLVQVLIDREVFWMVAERKLELWCGSAANSGESS